MEETKSTFITVLSWIFIILSGFGVLMTLLQNIMLNFIFPINDEAFTTSTSSEYDFFDILTSNIKLIFALVGLCVLLFFISSIGLLKRKNWARISIIVLLIIGIIYIVGSSIFNLLAFNDFNIEATANSTFNSVETFFNIFTILFLVGFIILYSWLIKKLISKKVISEFKI